VQDLVKQQTVKEPKLAQLDKVFYKLFTAVSTKGKPVIISAHSLRKKKKNL